MSFENVSQSARKYWRARNSIVGAFWDIDFLLFDRILATQRANSFRGDLLEIGALYGKSAIVLGCHAGSDEKVIVCDIFNDAEGGTDNVAENAQSYIGLNRKKFEDNYVRWVDRPPVVIAELSEHIVGKVEPRSLRFAHVDGSHLYSVVRMDIANTRNLMNDGGVVAMDDFRAFHTPGVAAAVWEAVATEGLIPICLSEQKLYGSWHAETARATREMLTNYVASHEDDINYGVQEIAGVGVLVVENPTPWELKRRVQRVLPSMLAGIRRGASPRPYLGSRVGEVQ